VSAISTILSNTWSFLSSITVPALGFSFGVLFLGPFVFLTLVKVIKLLLGFGATEMTADYRAGKRHDRNVKISAARKKDEK